VPERTLALEKQEKKGGKMHTIFLCAAEGKERQFSTTFGLSVTWDCNTSPKLRRHTSYKTTQHSQSRP